MSAFSFLLFVSRTEQSFVYESSKVWIIILHCIWFILHPRKYIPLVSHYQRILINFSLVLIQLALKVLNIQLHLRGPLRLQFGFYFTLMQDALTLTLLQSNLLLNACDLYLKSGFLCDQLLLLLAESLLHHCFLILADICDLWLYQLYSVNQPLLILEKSKYLCLKLFRLE